MDDSNNLVVEKNPMSRGKKILILVALAMIGAGIGCAFGWASANEVDETGKHVNPKNYDARGWYIGGTFVGIIGLLLLLYCIFSGSFRLTGGLNDNNKVHVETTEGTSDGQVFVNAITGQPREGTGIPGKQEY